MDVNDPRHGTANGYNNLHCRCELCRAAWTVHMRTRYEGRLPRAERYALLRANMKHGANAYKRGVCRCDVCKEGAALRRRAVRRRNGMQSRPAAQKYPDAI